MEKRFGILIMAICLICAVKAAAQVQQQWVERYDSLHPGHYEYVNDVRIDQFGNIYVAGLVDSLGRLAIVIVKYAPNGQILWDRHYRSTYRDDYCETDLAIDSQNNICVVGYGLSGGDVYDIVTIKYNSDGGLLWDRRYFIDDLVRTTPAAIKIDRNDNIYIGGTKMTAGQNPYVGILALKYDSAGTLIWKAEYAEPDTERSIAADLAVDNQGNVLIAGRSEAIRGCGAKCWLTVKFHSNGDLDWARTYVSGLGNDDEATQIGSDSLGNAYVGGVVGDGDFPNYIELIKYSSDGEELWDAMYNGYNGIHQDRSINHLSGMVVDPVGNIYGVGWSYYDGPDSTSGYVFCAIRYNSEGAQQWACVYCPDNIHYGMARSIAVDSDSCVYITGEFDTASFQVITAGTIKYNAAGDLVWETEYSYPQGANHDDGYGVAVDFQKNVVIVCQSVANDWEYDIATVKYSQSSENARDDLSPISTAISLESAYPNPFNMRTVIEYKLPYASKITLSIFDILGKKVATLDNGYREAGTYRVIWNSADSPSGIYFYQLSAGNQSQTKKLLLLK